MNCGLGTGQVGSILVTPASNAPLYAGLPGLGVWAWNAGTQCWTPLNTGLPAGDFTGAIVFSDPHHLNAARRPRRAEHRTRPRTSCALISSVPEVPPLPLDLQDVLAILIMPAAHLALNGVGASPLWRLRSR